MKVRILGCGASGGVPSLSHRWGECDPTNPKNKRTRTSILIEEKGFHLLIDSSPDMRFQLIEAGFPKIDAVVFTHVHADHIGGADDLRCFTYEKPLPLFINKTETEEFKKRMSYVFEVIENNEKFVPKFKIIPIEKNTLFKAGPFQVQTIEQLHGPGKSLGLRIGNFSYNTDLVAFESGNLEALKGVETLILGCPSPNRMEKHLNLEEALEWIDEVKPKRAILTHMGIRMDYDKLKKTLPSYIEPAYDGMEFEIP